MHLTEPTIDEVIENLSASHLNFLLVAEHSKVDINELITECNQLNFKIAGGIFPAIIAGQENSSSDIIIRKVSRNSEVSLFEDLDRGKRLDFLRIPEGANSAMILVDGLSNKTSYFLEEVYNNYWDNINFIGAGCGSLSLEQQPCVFTNQGFYMDTALMIFNDNLLSLGVNHGWKKIAGPFVISSAEGNTIHEINWRPAFEVYKEIVESTSGMSFDKESFFDIAKGYPFGIFREGMEDVVRDPITRDGNSLICVGEVTVNSVVNILEGKLEDLLEGAKKATEQAFNQSEYDEALIISCISRSLFEEKDFSKELLVVENVIKTQKNEIPLEGVLSLGEISSYGDGYLEFFNKTIVVGAFKDYD